MSFQFRILEKHIDKVLQNTLIPEKEQIEIISKTLNVYQELMSSINASEHLLNSKFIPFIERFIKKGIL
jgi:hypothetical protein